MAAPALAASDFAAHVSDAWARYLMTDRSARPAPHDHVYASAWRLCERRMVLELQAPDSQPSYPAEVLAKFRRVAIASAILSRPHARRSRRGSPPEVIGQQERFQLRDRKGRIAITGKTDARILAFGRSAPLEIKAWSPYLVDQIESFADLFDSPWTRSGAYQLPVVPLAPASPSAICYLDRSGLPRLIPVELDRHLDQMEDFLARAERVLDHHTAGTLPDYLDDPVECQRCAFYGHTCNPPLSAVGAQVLTDPELEVLLDRRERLKGAADDFDHLDKDIKRRLRGVLRGIVGPFHIRGKWGNQSRIEMPEDLKKQYTKTDPKGRFTLEIIRL